MVTNINLSAPETERKKTLLTGKLSLMLSVFLVLFSIVVFGAILYFKNSYSAQARQLESEINIERSKTSSATYSDLFDFQERLTLLDGVLGDHGYWDSFLKNFSQYILPDVRLGKLSFNKDNKAIDISGTASSFDNLSREIMLLRSYPGAESVEFRGANDGGSSGVSFDLSIKVNQSVLKK
jgi:hypothetical protein